MMRTRIHQRRGRARPAGLARRPVVSSAGPAAVASARGSACAVAGLLALGLLAGVAAGAHAQGTGGAGAGRPPAATAPSTTAPPSTAPATTAPATTAPATTAPATAAGAAPAASPAPTTLQVSADTGGAAPGGTPRTISATAATAGTIAADSVPSLAAKPRAPAGGGAGPAGGASPAAASDLPTTSALSNAFPNGASVPLDRVVAVVGDEPVLWSSVLERVNVERAQGRAVPADSAGQMELARQVANELINEELLVQKAQELKVEVSDDDVAPAVDAQLKRVRANFSSEVEFRNELKKAGFANPEEYRKTLIDQNKRAELQRKVIQKLKEDGKLIPVGVSEADITAAFNAHKAELPRRPATVTFRQIVVAPKPSAASKAAAKAKADSILAELHRVGGGAEQFALIAKRESMDQSTREQGGDLGWNRRGNMVPEFDRWMFALPPGQLSPVIETVFGYHIIRVDRVKPSEVKASHILIRWKIDTAQVLAARAEADSVLAKWKSGTNFDTLVLHHHDPNEEKGSLQPFPRDSLPPSYQAAFAGKKSGDFAGPFEIADRGSGHAKFVVAQILDATDGGDYTVADWRDRLRAQLADERAIARLLDSLRKETYVALRI